MESSDEDDDFGSHEWITPQSQINSVYQSDTEKGIRKLCSELLDLKEAVQNLSGNMHSKYLSFLRISEEVSEMEQELIELQKHVSTHGILVQDLMSGVCCELEEWNKVVCRNDDETTDEQICDIDTLLHDETEDAKLVSLEIIDVLLAEHKTDEVLLAIENEEKKNPELCEESLPTEDSSYRVAFLERKKMLIEQLVDISGLPSVGTSELKKVFSSLLKLQKGPLAHTLFLKAYTSRLQKQVEAFLPLCSIYSETYTATLSHFFFSTILSVAKESLPMFGDSATYTNRTVQWAETELEKLIRLVKENACLSESASALSSACICLQACLDYCFHLKSQGLQFTKLLVALMNPYMEEVFDMNFKRARRRILDLSGNEEGTFLSPQLCLPLSAAATSNFMLTNSGEKFMSIITDILERLTPMAVLHYGRTILNGIHSLFDKYVESLANALPGGPSEDEMLLEQKEGFEFRVETDAQQLALVATAFTVADELLPLAASRLLNKAIGSKDLESLASEGLDSAAITTSIFKDWRRHLQHSVDNLRDHFCRQYVLTFIYSREDRTRLDAHIYLNGREEDIFWDSDPLPSWPFQALFARLQQLASVAHDVLLGKEKVQKILLARLMETVVMWLSNEQEFWDAFEDSDSLQPSGLQQLILDMHFIAEITVHGGYPPRNINQIVSAIITRAIGIFSRKGIDPQSALPEDEWFADTAKAAINKLLGTSGSELSEGDDENAALAEDHSHSDESSSSHFSLDSVDSFASANMSGVDSPSNITDPED